MAATPLLLLTDETIFRRARSRRRPTTRCRRRRRARHHRGLRPLRTDRGARAARPPHSLHRARLQCRAGGLREALRHAGSITATPAGSTSCARPDADKARAFVLAIDDVEASLRVAEIVRKHFPDLPIYARARDRTHVHQAHGSRRHHHRARDVPLGAGIDAEAAARASALSEARGQAADRDLQAAGREAALRRLQYYTDLEKVRANAKTASDGARGAVRPRRGGAQASGRGAGVSLALSGEMAGDQPVYLGRMGERAHMARALDHRDSAFGNVAPACRPRRGSEQASCRQRSAGWAP